MKLAIDYERCTGHGRCYSLRPALFSDDEQGYGQVIVPGDLSESQLVDAQRAVQACPEQAIRLEP